MNLLNKIALSYRIIVAFFRIIVAFQVSELLPVQIIKKSLFVLVHWQVAAA